MSANDTVTNEKMVQTTDKSTQRGPKPEQQGTPASGSGKSNGKPGSRDKTTR
jgi:hypothetical protein